MKIAVFGSTGAVGNHVVRRALEREWGVVAFARTPSKLGELRERTEVIQGDVQDPDAVARAVDGVDAVISTVGHTKSSSDDVLEATARHLIESMRRFGVDRLVTLVGAGVTSDEDPSSFGRTAMRTVMQLLAGTMLEDAQRHTDMIRRTDLDWTVVRPPRLTDEPYTGEWHAGYMKLGPTSTMGREDLAEFMLQQVESDEWVGESPMVANS
jgi:putative NADH-flavin reductase